MARKPVRTPARKSVAESRTRPKPRLARLWPRLLPGVEWVALLLLTLAVYANTLGHDYAVDDKFVISENAWVRQGLAGIPKLLTTDSFAGFYAYYDNEVDLLPGGRYRPLALVTLAVEYSFWGEYPQASHAVNVLLYLLLIGLLWYLARAWMLPNEPLWAALAVVIFALHPTHTEAVANIKGRDEILSMIGMVVAMWGGLVWVRRGGTGYLLGSLLALFLGLLAKENGLMMLAILPLTVHTFSASSRQQLGVITAATAGVIFLYLLIRVGVGLSFETSSSIMDNAYLHADFSQSLATKTYILLRYLVLGLFPYPLTWDYSYQAFAYRTLAAPEFWASVLVHLGLVAFFLHGVRRRQVQAYAVGFWLFSIFIVSGYILNIGGAMMADRFLFQPSWGLALCVAGGLVRAGQRLRTGAPLALLLAVPVFILLATQTVRRNRDWHDSNTLSLADGDKYPESARAAEACGQAWVSRAIEESDTARKHEMLSKGEWYLKQAIAFHPQTVNGHLWLGRIHYLRGDLDQTEQWWLRARELSPRGIIVQQCMQLLTQAWFERGRRAQAQEAYDSAAVAFEKALTFKPDYAPACFQLGILYGMKKGDLEQGIGYLERAVELAPQQASYWYNLGGAYFTAGRYEKARGAWLQTLELEPQHRGALQGMQLFQPGS